MQIEVWEREQALRDLGVVQQTFGPLPVETSIDELECGATGEMGAMVQFESCEQDFEDIGF